MKPSHAANDNQIGQQIAETRKVWQPRIGRELTDADSQQFTHNIAGFFGVLADWSRSEKLAAANDAAAPAASNDDGEAQHER
jgi:hypothetical protein